MLVEASERWPIPRRNLAMRTRLSFLSIALALVLAPTAAADVGQDQPARASANRTSIYSGYSKVGYAQRSGSRWNVYEGYSKVGYVQRSGSRWNVYEGYSKVGYVQRSGSRWNVYESYSKIGYVQRSGSRHNIYESYSRVGYTTGPNGAPIGGAALLLAMLG
jgi:hypothetical protein